MIFYVFWTAGKETSMWSCNWDIPAVPFSVSCSLLRQGSLQIWMAWSGNAVNIPGKFRNS
jgi:hypothetical protein